MVWTQGNATMPKPEQGSKTTKPRRIGVREFRGNLAGFLQQAARGQTFLIASHDQIVAEVRPPPAAKRQSRQPGALRGRIRMAADFDTLPSDVLAAMEGEEA